MAEARVEDRQGRNGLGGLWAVILAGGLGTRLRPVVSDRPKVMAAVRGKPFLSYLLDWLEEQGLRKVMLCTGYLGDRIESFYGSGYGRLSLSYCREDEPRGTAGALALAMPRLDGARLLVLNGDSFCDLDLDEFLGWHLRQKAEASLVTVYRPDSGRYGTVVFDSSGQVKEFGEKSRPGMAGWINGGIYLFQRRILKGLVSTGPLSIEYDLLPSLVGKKLYAFQAGGRFIDIGTPEDYLGASKFFSPPSYWKEAGPAFSVNNGRLFSSNTDGP